MCGCHAEYNFDAPEAFDVDSMLECMLALHVRRCNLLVPRCACLLEGQHVLKCMVQPLTCIIFRPRPTIIRVLTALTWHSFLHSKF